MARVLVIYASDDGQTSKIALRLGEILREHGADVFLRDGSKSDAAEHLATFDGVVIGSPIHYGRHSKAIRAFVDDHRAILQTRHTAFFSVSLSASVPTHDAGAAKHYLEGFTAETHWKPDQTASFAGAIRHSHYGIFRTLMVRLSLRKTGAPEPGDHEYTDWKAVAAFAEAFAKRIEVPKREGP